MYWRVDFPGPNPNFTAIIKLSSFEVKKNIGITFFCVFPPFFFGGGVGGRGEEGGVREPSQSQETPVTLILD